MDDFVNVSIRIKPSFDIIANSSLQVISKQPAVLLVLDKKSQAYHFDNIFSDDVKQEEVYNDTVKKLVGKVKSGYNCTVFAYGQTGTGKSYTIGTNPDLNSENEAGLIARTLQDFFCSGSEDNDAEIEISFIEIYNEKVFDLLVPKNKEPLSVKGFTVQGFKKMKVCSAFEALHLLQFGNRKRHIGETKQNSNSSRSHAIFSIYCCTRDSEKETVAKLNLVDLAGSESVRKTGNHGPSFLEGININKGLLSLGQVMTALSTNSNHVPYRQSIITTILQDSLNKRNFVSLIACVSSNLDDLGETLQTLEFSNRVKKMKNKPEVNEVLLQYKKDNPSLFVNAVKGQTPLKRSAENSYETPFNKKARNVLPLIQEPPSINSLNFDNSPLFSSSMTSGVSETPQNFSPVIRKYMSRMEDSIMSRLEDVIKNTLKRPVRASPRIRDKENFFTSRLISSENKDNHSLNLVSEDDNVMNSPEGKEEVIGSLQNIESNSEQKANNLSHKEEETKDNDDLVFKVPAPKTDATNTNMNTVRRRSVRLQLKKRVSETKNENIVKRRSVRIQMRQSFVAESDSPVKKMPMRRSMRLKNDNSRSLDDANTYSPCANCLTKKSKTSRKSEENLKQSPITRRTKIVLDILNSGSIRDLEKLHTVGTKTAEKILLFRQLKGKFDSISDIAEMPYWSKKKYDKFKAENFLMR